MSLTPQPDPPADTAGPLLSMHGISRTFDRAGHDPLSALSDVDLEIRRGEIVALIGASGCGKSTLLRVIAGLDKQFTGDLSWDVEPRPGKDIGFVFQDPVLLPWRSVRRNARFGLEAQGVDRTTADQRVTELLEMVGLDGFDGSLPRQLSGGMRQRLSIVRALAYDPMILLMDEPFGALDQITREKLHDDLLRIWARDRKTIVLVTHAVDEAAYLADRVVVMTPRPGQIRAVHDVPLPRPRDESTKLLPEFAEFQAMLRKELA